jgi:hypothetical protein
MRRRDVTPRVVRARQLRAADGQSTLETVAVLPLMIAVALAVGHVLAAGLAHELTGHAAEAGAIALIRGGDAEESVKAALPEWADDRVEVRVRDRRVRVRLEPPSVIPGAADLLASAETADAGPSDPVIRTLHPPPR